MKNYRKKRIVIEAEQWFGQKHDAVCDKQDTQSKGIIECHIHTLEGFHVISHGDWIIRGIKGEFYPCKPDIFEATYEKV